MNPISITVTGRLGDDPRTFTTRDGTAGVELRLAVDLPARSAGDSITRWIKVTAFGLLATRTAESVRKGDRVTVLADDLIAEAWAATGTGEPRARVTLRAREIAASMAFDTLRTGYADRKAARWPPRTASPTTCRPASRPSCGSCAASPPPPDPSPGGGGQRARPRSPCLPVLVPARKESRDESSSRPAPAADQLPGRPAGRHPAPARLHPPEQPRRGRRRPQPAGSRSRSATTCPTRPTPTRRPRSPRTRRGAGPPAHDGRGGGRLRPGPLVTPVADALRAAAARTGVELLRRAARRGRPVLVLPVPRPVLLPARGRPVRPRRASRRGGPGRRRPAGPGQPGRAGRHHRPGHRDAAEAMRRRPSGPSGPRPGSPPAPGSRRWIGPGLAAVRAAIAAYRDGGSISSPMRHAWLALVLTRAADPRRRLGPDGPRPPRRAPAAVDRPGPPRPARLRRRARVAAGVHRLAGRRRRAGQHRPRPRPGR